MQLYHNYNCKSSLKYHAFLYLIRERFDSKCIKKAMTEIHYYQS